jgi:ABC-type bacteriocin/lantibiotic exporter with double-glycine peptidase domain
MIKKIIHIYKILLPFLWKDKKAIVATLFTLLLIGLDTVASTYFPYIWKNIISADIQSTPISWFLARIILLFVTWFFVKNARNLRDISFFPITNQAIKEIRLRAILKAHTVSLKNLEQYTVQEIISATSRISQSIRVFMRVSFISIFPSITKIVTLSITLFNVHKLCFGIIGASYAGFIVATFCLKYYSHSKYKAWHLADNVTVAMGQNLYNTAIIRFKSQVYNLQLKKLFDLEADAWNRYNSWVYLLDIIADFIFYLGTGIVFCFLIIDYKQGIIGVDKIVLIYGLVSSIRNSVIEIIRNLAKFFGSTIALNKTLDILNLPSENKPLQLTDVTPQRIQLSQVSFSYNISKKLLEDVNLTIHPGDKIGILGPSGTGKSTLCQIIAGLIEPDLGTVLYGNLPIGQIRSASLGKVLRYIPQIHLMQELAVEQHKYGINLKKQAFSGGEYQRHLLQEALESKPQILILDETLNSLDELSANQLLTDILATIPTVIMASHSHTLLNNMQRVFELKDRNVIEYAKP